VVEDCVNGWLCKVKDAGDLAERMLRFAAAPAEQRLEMGRRSRLKAEREFDEKIVLEAYLAGIDATLCRR
jgi:glycosyltransferase involved in cell wall biosynthesis